jgi:quercetin dioxygenase-like cupin family protein
MMQSDLDTPIRHFHAADHLRHLLAGEWLVLVDDRGVALPGIRGRAGVAALTLEGIEIGADLIEMQPGSAFPFHLHPGEHILYVIAGQGTVRVGGAEHVIRAGDSVFIPAECPHHVANPHTAGELVLLSVGYPHKGLAARDRMRTMTAAATA